MHSTPATKTAKNKKKKKCVNFLCNVRRHKEYQLRFPTLSNPFKNVSPQQISLCVFTNYCFDSDVCVCFFALCSVGCCCAFNICPERLGSPLCESTHKSISHRHFFVRCIFLFCLLARSLVRLTNQMSIIKFVFKNEHVA